MIGARKFADREWRKILKKCGDELVYHDWTVAIVERTWTKKTGKSGAMKEINLKDKNKGYDLNFCPVCGKGLQCDS